MGQAISQPDRELEGLVAVRSVVAFKKAETNELKVISQMAQGVFEVARAAVHVLEEDWLHCLYAGAPIVNSSSERSKRASRLVFSPILSLLSRKRNPRICGGRAERRRPHASAARDRHPNGQP